MSYAAVNRIVFNDTSRKVLHGYNLRPKEAVFTHNTSVIRFDNVVQW